MQKTGSQVLDSICISEAEKEAVLTLIREEVRTFITLIQHEICYQCVCVSPQWIFSLILCMPSSAHSNHLFSDHH